MGEVAGVRPYRFIESVNLTSLVVPGLLLLAGLVLCLGSAFGLTKALCASQKAASCTRDIASLAFPCMSGELEPL